MTSFLIPKHGSTPFTEQKDQEGLEQSPDPILLSQTYCHSQGLNGHYDSDPTSPIDLPSWDTLCVSAEQSESSSDVDQLDETNLDQHPLNKSNSSPKFQQIPTDLLGDTPTVEKTPPSDNHAQEIDIEQPALHLHTQATLSTATPQTLFTSRPPSVGLKYSTQPTLHTSATGTTASQIDQLNTKLGPSQPHSSFIGVVITRPPPQRQTVTQKLSPPATFQDKSYSTSNVDLGVLVSIANSSKPLRAQTANPEEEEESSLDSSTPSILHEPLHSPSSPGTPLPLSVLLAPSSPSKQSIGPENNDILVKTRNSLPNDENLGVPLVQAEVEAPTSSLAEALMSAFTKNTCQTQSDYPPKKQCHPPLLNKIRPTNVIFSSSSIHTHMQTEQQQSYIRKLKVPYSLNEKGKGRVLDEKEYAELLGADVVDVAFGTGLEASNTDQVRRSNLRHLLGLNQARGDTNLLDGPRHVPPRFAKHTVSRDDDFLDMLERTFGPDCHWGGGPKPKLVVKSPSTSEDSRAASPNTEDGYDSGAENNEAPTSGFGVRKRRALDVAPNGDAREPKRSRMEEPELEPTSIPKSLVANWVVLLQGLVKGKAKMQSGQVAFLSKLLNTIDKVKESVSYDIVLDSKIWQAMRQVSELAIEEIPFEDDHDLRGRARAIALFWSLKWSNKVESS